MTLSQTLAVLYGLTLTTGAPALPVFTDIRGAVPTATRSILDPAKCWASNTIKGECNMELLQTATTGPNRTGPNVMKNH